MNARVRVNAIYQRLSRRARHDENDLPLAAVALERPLNFFNECGRECLRRSTFHSVLGGVVAVINQKEIVACGGIMVSVLFKNGRQLPVK
jgi:hypothetical protein